MTLDKVCVGEIGAPHGVRGLFRVRSFTEPASKLFVYPLTREDGTPIVISCKGSDTADTIAGMAGATTREAAVALRHVKLYAPRDMLPALAEGEYYQNDLIGLTALADSVAIGTIIALHDFGAGLMLEIERGRGVEPLLLPFTDSSVPAVDMAGGTVTVVVPEII